MKWYIAVLKKYAVFQGRASRKEFWMFYLLNSIFIIIAITLDILLGLFDFESKAGLISTIYILAVLLPYLAVTVRRLHDVGKSGWWIFISLVPFIGLIWLLVLLCTDSQPGENKYGPNPKEIKFE